MKTFYSFPKKYVSFFYIGTITTLISIGMSTHVKAQTISLNACTGLLDEGPYTLSANGTVTDGGITRNTYTATVIAAGGQVGVRIIWDTGQSRWEVQVDSDGPANGAIFDIDLHFSGSSFSPNPPDQATGNWMVVPDDMDGVSNDTGSDFGCNGVSTLSGTGTQNSAGNAPELDIRNNADNADITDASTTISTTLGTDLGDVCHGGTVSSSSTFRVENNGTGVLTFDADALTISNTTDFSITTDLTNSGTVAASGVETFTIQFDPQSVGTKNCTVTINSDDANEDPYTFNIEGVGIDPTIEVTATTASVSEDGVTNLVYQFTRTCTSGSLIVNFSIEETAQDSDYVVSGATSYDSGTNTGTITFADGDATVDLTVNPTDDSLIEANESVTVLVENP